MGRRQPRRLQERQAHRLPAVSRIAAPSAPANGTGRVPWRRGKGAGRAAIERLEGDRIGHRYGNALELSAVPPEFLWRIQLRQTVVRPVPKCMGDRKSTRLTPVTTNH